MMRTDVPMFDARSYTETKGRCGIVGVRRSDGGIVFNRQRQWRLNPACASALLRRTKHSREVAFGELASSTVSRLAELAMTRQYNVADY